MEEDTVSLLSGNRGRVSDSGRDSDKVGSKISQAIDKSSRGK